MHNKDWVQEAAIGISEDNIYDVDGIRAHILKHCPFKPNIAYMPVVRIAPGNVQDWASRAAEYLSGYKDAPPERVAAVIFTFAEPLIVALKASYRSHHFHLFTTPGPNRREAGVGYFEGCPKEFFIEEACTCGADAHNAMIDEALQ